jgi:excisionase family DNA binding protein
MTEPLTTKEVAERLRLRPATVLRWARDGRIPCIRLSGSVVRFSWTAVAEAIQEEAERGTGSRGMR